MSTEVNLVEVMEDTAGSEDSRKRDIFLLAYITWLAHLRGRNIEPFLKEDCRLRSEFLNQLIILAFVTAFTVRVIVELFQ